MSTLQPYKILVLIKSLGLGGAERLIMDSLPYLDQDRFSYTFAYFLPWKDFLEPQLTEAGFPVYCLGTFKDARQVRKGSVVGLGEPAVSHHGPVAGGGGWAALKVMPVVLWQLIELQRRRQFDLIHADMPLSGVLARLMGHWQGIPVVYTEHNLQERYHPLTRWLNRLTYGWNRQVLAVSAEVAVSIARFGLDKKTRVEPLLNGVPVEQVRAEASNVNGLREELGIPSDHLVVGTVAVFRRQKRLQDWLEVAARIAAQRADVTFLLVGHGPEEAALKAKVQALGLEERVRLPGFRPDGRRVLGLMDVYFMSSKYEGLPVALLEAMALGKPVVATAVGGIPELVETGEEGFLSPVGGVDELTNYIMKLLDDPPSRGHMGQRGANKVAAKFHTRNRVRFIENLYLEVLQESRGEVMKQ